MTEVLQCTCKSEFQDELYGKGFRLMNSMGKDKTTGYRCTVCNKEYRLGETKKK